jgi:hypothetical protein
MLRYLLTICAGLNLASLRGAKFWFRHIAGGALLRKIQQSRARLFQTDPKQADRRLTMTLPCMRGSQPSCHGQLMN